SPAPALEPLPGACPVDEDAAHGLGRGPEEVAPAVEVLVADEPQVRLVDQRGRLERLARCLRGHPGGRELAQLVVDEREQLGRGSRVAGGGCVEELRDVWHPVSVFRLRWMETYVIGPRERAETGKADSFSGREYGR